MIVGQPPCPALTAIAERHGALDAMLREWAARDGDAIALADPPDRERFTDGPPRRLTFAQAERAVSALAERLRRIGLQTDQIVGLQMPNTVEAVLATLAVMRAGLIAAPMPLLWRRADAVSALSGVGAKALITCRRIGAVDHCELAMRVAADIFTIRQVCAFGRGLPDGVSPLDECFDLEPHEAPPPERSLERAAHVAVVTWEAAADGFVPIARSHAQALAAALPIIRAGAIEPGAPLLTTLTLSSFSGVALGLAPWLLNGGTLCLHHPFDAAALAAQQAERRCAAAVIPGVLASPLADAALLSPRAGVRTIIAAWRAPERLEASAVWRDVGMNLVDVQVFGETGLVAARRDGNGRPARIPIAGLAATPDDSGVSLATEVMRTDSGTLALRGPIAPRASFPPGAERSGGPRLPIDEAGFVDTGFACRIDRESGAIVVTAPPAGSVNVGGYRLRLSDLRKLAAGLGPGCTIAALPDMLNGQRLAGHADNREEIERELRARGINPLVAGAFRERRARSFAA